MARMIWRLAYLAGVAPALAGCPAEQDCRPEAAKFCYEGVLYHQDACGILGEVIQICPNGCLPDERGCDPCARASCDSLGKQCGAWEDGCGGELACGECAVLESCSPQGECACRFEACGEDCCASGEVCALAGCCRPSCGERVCGPDGCGGECGACGAAQACGPDGQCACLHEACGQACCQADEVCFAGACCRPSCAGRDCGPDGCGGDCGTCAAEESCKTDGLCGPAGWQGVAITAARAPDERSVILELEGDPGEAAAEDPAAYTLGSSRGGLAVIGARLEAGPRVVLTTARQKLGVTYRIEVGGLQADFEAADTALLWVYDWDTLDQVRILARRAGVGEFCVVYIQDGFAADDLAETIWAFDDRVYPTLTEQLIAAPDLDGNGRILLLGLDGRQDYGGYFSPLNAYRDADTMAWWGMHSNEMEIVHGNVTYGTFDVQNVVTHEFGHLLYHERHGLGDAYWDYHDEGLAECAVHSVWGVNQYAIDYYLWDPDGVQAGGLSVIHWEYARYDNYVAAYLLWAYLAGRLGGVDAFGEIFELPTGSPEEVDALLSARLGQGLGASRLDQLIATWAQAEDGPYSYSGMLRFPASSAPAVPAGWGSLDLEALGGAFFRLAQSEVDYPGTQGPHIRYAGVDASGAVDLEPPFRVEGGALVVANVGLAHQGWPSEHSGPDVPASLDASPRLEGAPAPSPAWRSPPPIRPDRLEDLARWRDASRGRPW